MCMNMDVTKEFKWVLQRMVPAQSLTMGFANLWFSHPRKFGPGSRSCRVCSNHHGLIRKYGLDMCRRCFREYAKDIGFKKLD
ncbi:ribosomal protein S14p/S29e [Ancylostoma ceylanicum]|uniref:Small ribosomal subunit protein uS14 n=2 Tax=Ancylostoma TaxID=29169 RepID=A0A0D6LQ39_9BILA|nr:ribosomal protein S14p/S29e [Ancylostoma ceylanicum]